MLESWVRNLGRIALPEWTGRRKYMHTFDAGGPAMAAGFEPYLPVVSSLCRAAAITGNAHLTVDESIVEAGRSQRRPGAHVDGCFVPEERGWTHGGGGGSGWRHRYNAAGEIRQRMAVIVATDVAGCRVYPGRFEGEPAEDGDLEHIRSRLGAGQLLAAGQAWLLSPDCVHESLRFERSTRRTFLRIALESLPGANPA